MKRMFPKNLTDTKSTASSAIVKAEVSVKHKVRTLGGSRSPGEIPGVLRYPGATPLAQTCRKGNTGIPRKRWQSSLWQKHLLLAKNPCAHPQSEPSDQLGTTWLTAEVTGVAPGLKYGNWQQHTNSLSVLRGRRGRTLRCQGRMWSRTPPPT